MEPTVVDFLKEFHPNILDEYLQFSRKDVLPSIGSKVEFVKDFRSQKSGTIKYVMDYSEGLIELASEPSGEVDFLLEEEGWWSGIRIIREPKIDNALYSVTAG